MKLRTKIWLIVAACLFVVGATLFVGALQSANWDFGVLSTHRLETNRHELTESFQNITISTVSADISVLPATDGKVTVVCTEWENQAHTVEVKDGTLTVKMEDSRKWYHHIGIHWGDPKITVYLPSGDYGNLKVNATTGDITIRNTDWANIDLSVTTGDIQMADIACTRFSVQAVTGDIRLKNVIATDSMTIDSTTGDVTFDDCDAPTITVDVTTGDVTGSLRTGKVFDIHVTTGDVEVPPSAGSGICKISATTGDIRLTIQ